METLLRLEYTKTVSVEGNYKNNELDGLWTWWDEEGIVTRTQIYKDGELVK